MGGDWLVLGSSIIGCSTEVKGFEFLLRSLMDEERRGGGGGEGDSPPAPFVVATPT